MWWIGFLSLSICLVGCGTATPTPSPTITIPPSLVEDIITPAVTVAFTKTPTPAQAPSNTPYIRRPLPATWTFTPTPTATLSPTPTITPSITSTPTATPTRTLDELCESFNPYIGYDPEIAYPKEAVLTIFAGIDDSQFITVFEATERITGESIESKLDTGGLYQMGEMPLINFPVIGTYDWVFYLQAPDDTELCHVRGVLTIRETSLFDLIPTVAPATPTPTRTPALYDVPNATPTP